MVTVSTSELDQLAVKLFQKFARIEYALKAAGFHYGGGEAKPNWNKFASSVIEEETATSLYRRKKSVFPVRSNHNIRQQM